MARDEPAKTRKGSRAAKNAKKEPSDVGGWLVYADSLLTGGDARAELIVIEEQLANGGDAALRKKRDALFRKHAASVKGALARGILAAGGATLGDDSVSGRIQDLLVEKYSLAHLVAFAKAAAGNAKLDPDQVAKKLDVTLAPSFAAFHRWARTVATRFPTGKTITLPDGGAYAIEGLDRIVQDTEMWRTIQRDQPDREWRPGFVHVVSWNSAYEMVMDTKADVTKPPHQLFYWDFKGGSDYQLCYKMFDALLEDVLKLLKSGSYFPPVDDDDEGELDDLYELWSDTVHRSRRSFPFAR
jgi:hypothetical protein